MEKTEVITETETETETKDENELEETKGVIGYLKRKGYWKTTKSSVIFAVHFSAVLLVLFASAVIFAYLEDDELLGHQVNIKNASVIQRTGNVSDSSQDYADVENMFWRDIENTFRTNLSIRHRAELIRQFKGFIAKQRLLDAEVARLKSHKVHKKWFHFWKWFYFSVIAASTIGYGDVTPKTDDGKLFYIFFSILGMILFISLLKRCGSVISAANRKMCGLISCRFLSTSRHMNCEHMSLFCLLLICLCYIWFGAWYVKSILTSEVAWSVLDTAYYWIVTFTTVGFGDLTYPLELEVEYRHFFVIYRIFGLAILAAILDAIGTCMEKRTEIANKLISMEVECIKAGTGAVKEKLKELKELTIGKADSAISKEDEVLSKLEETRF